PYNTSASHPHSHVLHRDLHSFPTRRSSDLTDQEVVRGSHSSRGVYSNVRNPIYSSVFLFSAGLLLTTRNFMSLFIIGLNWFIFTAVIIFIEEPKLIDTLDRDYIEYTIQVNRLIPWFSQYFQTREFTSKDK